MSCGTLVANGGLVDTSTLIRGPLITQGHWNTSGRQWSNLYSQHRYPTCGSIANGPKEFYYAPGVHGRLLSLGLES